MPFTFQMNSKKKYSFQQSLYYNKKDFRVSHEFFRFPHAMRRPVSIWKWIKWEFDILPDFVIKIFGAFQFIFFWSVKKQTTHAQKVANGVAKKH